MSRYSHAMAALLCLVAGTASPAWPVGLSVGPDESLSYPAGMETLADEHTSFLPIGPRSPSNPTSYLVFAASNTVASRRGGHTGAVVLETTDLRSFRFAPGYGDMRQGGLVLSSPATFTNCNLSDPAVFDQNYAAPGSVVQDPTRPPGNLIMVYEAEQHCAGRSWNHNFYASIGLARSSDMGMTWPPPADNAADRYAILQVPGANPETPNAPNMGDALPSAFVDDVASPCPDVRSPRCDAQPYLYVLYTDTGSPSSRGDGFLHVARARLGSEPRLAFRKWANGGWNGEGIGGPDGPVMPEKGCDKPAAQLMSQITYNETVGRYLLTFVCLTLNNGRQVNAGWYFSTATSLDTQNWSPPRMIENSQFAVGNACPHGTSFDGWYPSFMTPGLKPGHTGRSGKVFLLNGCDGSLGRSFVSRSFVLTP